MQAIWCDLDGTLTDPVKRKKFVEQKPKDYKKFFSLMHTDSPNSWCVAILDAMEHIGFTIVYVTGRPESYRKVSEDWLKKHRPNGKKYFLYMRPDNVHRDYKPDPILKREIYFSIRDTFDFLFCLEDRPSVVRELRRIGLTVLQCQDKEF